MGDPERTWPACIVALSCTKRLPKSYPNQYSEHVCSVRCLDQHARPDPIISIFFKCCVSVKKFCLQQLRLKHTSTQNGLCFRCNYFGGIGFATASHQLRSTLVLWICPTGREHTDRISTAHRQHIDSISIAYCIFHDILRFAWGQRPPKKMNILN